MVYCHYDDMGAILKLNHTKDAQGALNAVWVDEIDHYPDYYVDTSDGVPQVLKKPLNYVQPAGKPEQKEGPAKGFKGFLKKIGL